MTTETGDTRTPGKAPRLLIISPAKDEEQYIETTIAALENQTILPALWVIVDDGSSDRTGEIADEAAKRNTWIKVVHRPRNRPRRVGPGVIEAFYEGLSQADLNDFDFVCKLDADLDFAPDYFETIYQRFEEDPRLGTASGKAYIPVDGELVLERTGDQFSHGVSKLFRRECFQEIGGFVHEVMWDGIDCHRCRMLGWNAVSYDDPKLAITHLRQMGSSFKSVYHGRMRWGRGQYFMGTHPVYLLAISSYRMLERPWILGGVCILLGYVQAAVQRKPRYEDLEFRRHLHSWQFSEIWNLVKKPFRRLLGSPTKPELAASRTS